MFFKDFSGGRPRSEWLWLAVTLACPTYAQSGTPGSLIADPQRGATPPPVLRATSLPSPGPASAPIAPVRTETPGPVALPVSSGGSLLPQVPAERYPSPPAALGGLPAPSGDPMRIDPGADPILQLSRAATSMTAFRDAIASAVRRNPALGETVAQADEAEGARNEARARQYPTIDLSLSYFHILSRAFSDDPLNILERSRPEKRTDGSAHVQQSLIDFGANGGRIRAGDARLEAAELGIDDTTTQLALRAVGAWYNVFGYRALVALGHAFSTGEQGMRASIAERVAQGYSAPGDAAQVESYVAATAAQVADFERSLANAEAQYAQLVGSPAPASLGRAPLPPMTIASAERAQLDAEALPSVKAARALAEAAVQDRKSVKADMLPNLSGSIDAGRYGVLETAKDYDVRGTVTISQRFFGGGKQRVEQADARARGAQARFERTREEAQRDAAIAWTDVRALEAAKAAIEDNYIASRRSRDVLAERFRVSRGTLFDLMNADNNYFSVAARYIQTVTELDTARYALLARTGKLLEALSIEPTRSRR